MRQEYLVVLESMFAAYKAHTITNYFWMEHWMNLLEDCQLIGGSVGKKLTLSPRLFNLRLHC